MPECLLFDLFGTLVEYEPDRTLHQLQDTYDLVSQRAEDLSYEQFIEAVESVFDRREKAVQLTGEEFLMVTVAKEVSALLELDADDEFHEEFVRRYMREWMSRLRPVPGVTGLLHRLSAHYRLGLISNTHYPPMVYLLLQTMDLTATFELVTLSAEVGVAKPFPQIFQTAFRKLNIEAGQAIYIGDSFEHDYQGAQRVGMDCYLIGKHARVPRGRHLRSILDLPIHFNTAR